MIGRLRGVLVHCEPGLWILDCGGVGYEVAVPDAMEYTRPQDSEQTVHIHHHVQRDDGKSLLYGFLQKVERDIFRKLLRSRGLGTATALQLLSELGSSGLLQALQNKDANILVKVKGVGRKTADRLLLDLADAAHTFGTVDIQEVKSSPRAAVVAALKALGVKPTAAVDAVDAVLQNQEGLDEEELLRASLQVAQLAAGKHF